jgi:WD40 repeat protein
MRTLPLMLRRPSTIFAVLIMSSIWPATLSAVEAQQELKAEIVAQTGHSDKVVSVAFSPDGRFALSGSYDGTLALWEVATDAKIRVFRADRFAVQSVAFLPDGRVALSRDLDNTLKLWDIATGAELRSFETSPPLGAGRGFAVSPDGSFALLGSRDGTLALWDIATGEEVRRFVGHTAEIKAVTFSADGLFALSAGSDKTLRLWDVATGKEVRRFVGHTAEINAVAFSPDGLFALSGGSEDFQPGKPKNGTLIYKPKNDTLRLWEVATGKEVRRFIEPPVCYGDHICEPQGHSPLVESVAFSPDGRFALSGGLEGLMLWDVATGGEVRKFSGDLVSINSVAFSPDGRFALTGGGPLMALWEVATGDELRRFAGHTGPVRSVAFSPDSRFALSGSDESMKLWDMTTGRELRQFTGTDWVRVVAFSPDGRFALSADKTLTLWDIATGNEVRRFVAHEGQIDEERIEYAAISPDGHLALSNSCVERVRRSGCIKRSINLWDVETGRSVRGFTGYTGWGSAVAFSPDGSFALSGDCDKKNLFCGGYLKEKEPVDLEYLYSGGSLKVWDMATGKLRRKFGGHLGRMNSLAISRDGRFALSGDGTSRVKLWDVASGRKLRDFGDEFDDADDDNALAFSPDGRFALSAKSTRNIEQALHLWEVASGKNLGRFAANIESLISAAFSPDGRFALSGGGDGVIRVWDVESGQELARMIATPESDWLTITPNGFFSASRRDTQGLAIVRGLDVISIGQMHQSLFNPDLVREALAGDPDGEVKRAAEFINLDKVIDSGPAPLVEITSSPLGGRSDTDLVTVTAHMKDRGKGIGRIEWRVNGVTTAVSNARSDARSEYEVNQTLALDPGENTIEVVAYNARNLLTSLPAQTTITYNAPADAEKPKLYVLAIGINAYHDEGWTPPGTTKREYFPPLELAVNDARSVAEAFKEAGSGMYGQVIVKTAFDEQATAEGLERIVQDISAEINPRDTFILFAAAHGYSNNGHFYLLPQDYQGGTDPMALTRSAIGQERLQDWIANRIKARRGIILLDTCESGALTNGYTHSRIDAPASEAAVGRLHEATGRPVLTAAAAGEHAHEGYRGHGFFTWALIDALFHGDTNGDGLIEVSELATHVQDMVPKISPEMKGRGIAEVLTQRFKEERQTAHFGSTGSDFPVVRRLQ